MKRLTSIISALAITLAAGAQGRQAPAVVEMLQEDFVMSSGTNATHSVKSRITVNTEEGLEASVFSETTDSYRTLSAFSATISVNGKKIKARLSDVEKTHASSSLVDDIVSNYYVPNASFPYTVEYEYTVTYRNGVPSFPAFVPVRTFDIPVENASFSISVPTGTKIMYKSSDEPTISQTEGKDFYTWTYRDIPPLKQESLMPPAMDLVPYVRACPAEFTWGKSSGSQRSWKDLGAWNASLFPGESIPEDVRARIAADTEECEDEAGKIRKIYEYLRDNTRYVSIQLGIGGYAPSSPETVSKTGYGDCKALSYFMRSLLKGIGIESDYVTLSTKDKDFDDSYSAMGQMNHAMLCVPVGSDTLWVECTNPSLPLGYRHSGIAGHQVLLVKEGGESKMVRVPDYADSLRCSTEHTELTLSPDGSIKANCTSSYRLDDAEALSDIRKWETKSQLSRLTRGFRGSVSDFKLNNVSDNFNAWTGGSDYVPQLDIDFELTSGMYSKVMGDRLFVPVPAFSRTLSVSRSERVHEMYISEAATFIDRITVHIPEGYRVEALPKFNDMNTQFLDIISSVVEDGDEVTVTIRTASKPGRFPKEAYEEYRTVARNFNRIYESNLVLIRKQD